MEPINIRSIQHYLYCPHRWGLIEIGDAWAENYFVVKANLMHERVHDPDRHYSARGKKVFTAVPVWSDEPEYDLYGVVDCIEAARSENGDGALIGGVKYKLCIVEYKPTKPESVDYHEEDVMQLFAQKLCVDYVFGGQCTAVIYYGNVKKRIELPFSSDMESYREKLFATLKSIRDCTKIGKIPPVLRNQYCGGCSMRDLCMPKIKQRGDVRQNIHTIMEDLHEKAA
jgi:CRISPR-associated exonuclease Cas4